MKIGDGAGGLGHVDAELAIGQPAVEPKPVAHVPPEYPAPTAQAIVKDDEPPKAPTRTRKRKQQPTEES